MDREEKIARLVDAGEMITREDAEKFLCLWETMESITWEEKEESRIEHARQMSSKRKQ